MVMLNFFNFLKRHNIWLVCVLVFTDTLLQSVCLDSYTNLTDLPESLKLCIDRLIKV